MKMSESSKNVELLSYSHSVFYPFEELSCHFDRFEIIVCLFFQFGSLIFYHLREFNAAK